MWKVEYASQTVHHLRNVMSKALQEARRWEWIDENPARMIELGKVRKVRAGSGAVPRRSGSDCQGSS